MLRFNGKSKSLGAERGYNVENPQNPKIINARPKKTLTIPIHCMLLFHPTTLTEVYMPDEDQTSTDITPYAPKGIPLESIIDLYNKGLNNTEIAKIIGCDRSNISRRIQAVRDELDSLPKFKHHRADILALHQSRLLNSITPNDINKSSPYQRVGMMALLYDKERLERGQLTEITGYMDLSKALSQVQADRQRLARELGIDDHDNDSHPSASRNSIPDNDTIDVDSRAYDMRGITQDAGIHNSMDNDSCPAVSSTLIPDDSRTSTSTQSMGSKGDRDE